MFLREFKSYLELEKKYSSHTIISYLSDINEFKSFLEENNFSDLTDVNYSLIRQWMIKLVELKRTNKTINRKIASIKAYYNFLIQISKLKKLPFLEHTPLKISKNIVVPFSEKEMENVLNYKNESSTFKTIRNNLMIELFYSTGIRRSELINLKLTDFDFDQKIVRVMGKRNKERIIPLLENIVIKIKKYIEYREDINILKLNYLFLTSKGKKMYPKLVYNTINMYLGAVSTKKRKSPHILRHTFATHLLNEGVAINAVKELLGHSSLMATQIYTHNSLDELKRQYKKGHPREVKKEVE